MAKQKKSKSLVTTDYYKGSGPGLGSYPLAVQPNESLENTFMIPNMTPLGDASGAMKYQNIGSAYIGNGMNDAFIDAGFDPYAKKSLIKPSVVAQISENAFNTNLQANYKAPASPSQATSFSSGLFGSDPTLNNGAFNADDMAKYLSSPVSDEAMKGQGVGQYNGTLNGVQTQFTNDNLHTADAGSIKSASLDGTTYGGSNDQWVNGLSNFETLQGVAGLGNLAMGLYGMFGENGTNAVNKKNMKLMDQQIANNKDIMRTRTERAGDIKKYFG